MKDICIPVPGFKRNEEAEILVKVNGRKYQYIVRIFPWEAENGESIVPCIIDTKISRLKENIEKMYKDWELIHILTPPKNAKCIQVLFRKRQ